MNNANDVENKNNPFLRKGKDANQVPENAYHTPASNAPSPEFDAIIAEQFMRAYMSLPDDKKTEIIKEALNGASSMIGEASNGDGVTAKKSTEEPSIDDDEDLPHQSSPHDESEWLNGSDDYDVTGHGPDKEPEIEEDTQGSPNKTNRTDEDANGTTDGDERFIHQSSDSHKDNNQMEDEDDGVSDDWRTYDEMEADDDDSSVLIDNGDSGAIRLTDSIITYDTERFINEKTGKPYNRFRLKQDPPIITFKQHRSGASEDDDEMVSIIMTRPLAERIHALTGDILKAYDGIPLESKEKEPVTVKNIKKKLQDKWRYNPVQIVATVLIVVLVVIMTVVGFVNSGI